MNKKGLTIYGLLGIIAGVAIIVVIAIPIGKSIYEKKVQETYERQVDNVVASSFNSINPVFPTASLFFIFNTTYKLFIVKYVIIYLFNNIKTICKAII